MKRPSPVRPPPRSNELPNPDGLLGSGFNLVEGASASGFTTGASGASGDLVVGFTLSGTDGFVEGGLVVGKSGGFVNLPPPGGLKPPPSILKEGRLNLPILLYYFHLFFVGIKYKCLLLAQSRPQRQFSQQVLRFLNS
jgi:hypothetical protein